jgi:hypothetical protein
MVRVRGWKKALKNILPKENPHQMKVRKVCLKGFDGLLHNLPKDLKVRENIWEKEKRECRPDSACLRHRRLKDFREKKALVKGNKDSGQILQDR